MSDRFLKGDDVQESEVLLTNAERWKLIDLVNEEILRKQDAILAFGGSIQDEQMRLRHPVLMSVFDKLIKGISPRD